MLIHRKWSPFYPLYELYLQFESANNFIQFRGGSSHFRKIISAWFPINHQPHQMLSVLHFPSQNFNQAKDRKSRKSVTIITPRARGIGRIWGCAPPPDPSSLSLPFENKTKEQSLWNNAKTIPHNK